MHAQTHENGLFQGLLPTTGKRNSNIPAIVRKLQLMIQVARERRQLQRLSAHELKDIGIDVADVEWESRRSMWDLPSDR